MFHWSNATVDFSLVNGLDGDPCLHALFRQSGEAVLFDLGTIDALPVKALLKVKVVCVSHTHIDHFIGFDRLLRVNIPHGRTLEFCGPTGLARNIQGKLRGYIWNLVSPDQIRMQVHEISRDGQVSTFHLSNTDDYTIHPGTPPLPPQAPSSVPLPSSPACFVTSLSDGTRIEAVALDHGTDSIAFLCQAPLRFKVREQELARLGLTPGPWIRALQDIILQAGPNRTIEIDGRAFSSSELAGDVLTYEAPRLLGYVTDIAFHTQNLERLQGLLDHVETLVIEANFRAEHEAEARRKMHLTTRDAATIAKSVNAGHVQGFHFSKIYKGNVEAHASELASYLK